TPRAARRLRVGAFQALRPAPAAVASEKQRSWAFVRLRAARTHSPFHRSICSPLPPGSDATNIWARACLQSSPADHFRECCFRQTASAPPRAPSSSDSAHLLDWRPNPTNARCCSTSRPAARPDPSKSAVRGRTHHSKFYSEPRFHPFPPENPDNPTQSTLCPSRRFPSYTLPTSPALHPLRASHTAADNPSPTND